MKALSYTAKFKKDLKRLSKTSAEVELLLREVIELLLKGSALPQKLNDHPLIGAWKGHRDCHLKPDLVLIYKADEGEITLVRLGSHSDLF